MESTLMRISAAVITIIIILGVASNAAALVSLIRMRRWKFLHIVLASMFTSNLLGAGVGYIFTFLAMTKLYARIYDEPGRCKFDAFFVMWMSVASLYHVVALCLFRMLQIAKPLHARVINRKTWPAVWTISAAWFASLLLCFPPLVGWSNFIKVPKLQLCGLDFYSFSWSNRLYLGLAVLFGFALPLVLNASGYVLILRKRPDHLPPKFLCMELTMLAAFVLSWAPYAIIGLMAMASVQVSPVAELVCTFVAKASSIYNAIIFIVSHRICRLWRCGRDAKRIRRPCKV